MCHTNSLAIDIWLCHFVETQTKRAPNRCPFPTKDFGYPQSKTGSCWLVTSATCGFCVDFPCSWLLRESGLPAAVLTRFRKAPLQRGWQSGFETARRNKTAWLRARLPQSIANRHGQLSLTHLALGLLSARIGWCSLAPSSSKPRWLRLQRIAR